MNPTYKTRIIPVSTMKKKTVVNMIGGDSQKSDSFPSNVQYRLDFSNTEREKRKGGWNGIEWIDGI